MKNTHYPKGTLITMISISEWMAHTIKKTVVSTGEVAADGRGIFKESLRKRNKFMLRPFGPGMLVFEGEVPFNTDSEIALMKPSSDMVVTQFRGNACFNFVGDPSVIKDWIEKRNLNEAFDQHDRVLVIEGEKESLLFPDVETSHAVVLGIRAKTASNAS
jgi:hypothetical protein